MTTSTLTLTAFLTARLDEDEAVARAASRGPWSYGDIESVAGGSLYDSERMIASVIWDVDRSDGRIRRDIPDVEADANGSHIARHDPARVLREVEAKRAIVRAAVPQTINGLAMFEQSPFEAYVLRALASIYADHPEFRAEWAL